MSQPRDSLTVRGRLRVTPSSLGVVRVRSGLSSRRLEISLTRQHDDSGWLFIDVDIPDVDALISELEDARAWMREREASS